MNNKTLLSASSIEKDIKSGPKTNKISISKIVAEKLAKKALDKNIKKFILIEVNLNIMEELKNLLKL